MTFAQKIVANIGFLVAAVAFAYGYSLSQKIDELQTEFAAAKTKLDAVSKENDSLQLQFIEVRKATAEMQQVAVDLTRDVERLK